MSDRLRVVTYNVHKCRGLDHRVRPERIAEVLRATRPDIVALQEVIAPQAGVLARELGLHCAFGENRKYRGAAYGNAVLSRFAIRDSRNFDLTWRREARGALRVDFVWPGRPLHLFNVHLGTSYRERQYQARCLLSPEVLGGAGVPGPRIVLGDFNEWTRGLASRMLAEHMHSVDIRKYIGRRRTYPGLLPVLHLDHVYFDPPLELVALEMPRTRLALIASDHLPLIAEFRWNDGRQDLSH